MNKANVIILLYFNAVIKRLELWIFFCSLFKGRFLPSLVKNRTFLEEEGLGKTKDDRNLVFLYFYILLFIIHINYKQL